MKILLIGAYPPPVGGVSVHMSRLVTLIRSRGWNPVLLDLYQPPGESPPAPLCVTRLKGGPFRKLISLLRLTCRFRGDLIHIHLSAMLKFAWIGPLLLLVARHRPIILTIHSGSFPLPEMVRSPVKRMLQRASLAVCRHVDHIILVSEQQAEYLEVLGFPSDRQCVLPAFLGVDTVEGEVPEYLSVLEQGRPRLLISGYGLSFYGYDILLDALDLDGLRERVSLIVVMYGTMDEQYVNKISNRMQSFDSLFLKNLDTDEYQRLLREVDIYIRATDRDGDSISVREALARNMKVVASDCVTRPSGVRLFRTGNAEHLAKMIRDIMDDAPEPPEVKSASQGSWPGIENIYIELTRTR